jgi:peptidoglycan/LPS O-acetylase OafA/YrhL
MLHPAVAPLSLGNVGVLMFFVVSGFVIAEALDLFYRDQPARFLANRFLRLYPAYWAALPIAALCLWGTGQPISLGHVAIAVNVGLLPAFLPQLGTLPWISITWAVIAEFQFYIAAAATVAAASLLRRRAPVVAAVLVASLVLYGFVWATDAQRRFLRAFQFAPFFVAGVAAYLHMARPSRGAALLLLVSAALSLHAYVAYVGRAPGALATSTLLFAAAGALTISGARGTGAGPRRAPATAPRSPRLLMLPRQPSLGMEYCLAVYHGRLAPTDARVRDFAKCAAQSPVRRTFMTCRGQEIAMRRRSRSWAGAYRA